MGEDRALLHDIGLAVEDHEHPATPDGPGILGDHDRLAGHESELAHLSSDSQAR